MTGKEYLRAVTRFYFKPHWQTFLTTLYVVIFLYSAIYHINNVVLAVEYVFWTLRIATSLLELSFLFWGVAFVLALILPFSVSVYALFFPYEIWRQKHWNVERKFLLMGATVIVVFALLFVLNEVIKIIAAQSVIEPFINRQELFIGEKVLL